MVRKLIPVPGGKAKVKTGRSKPKQIADQLRTNQMHNRGKPGMDFSIANIINNTTAPTKMRLTAVRQAFQAGKNRRAERKNVGQMVKRSKTLRRAKRGR